MEIRFISSLTSDDEQRVAQFLLNALGTLLDRLPLAYMLRIETSGGRILTHNHPGGTETPAAPRPAHPRIGEVLGYPRKADTGS